MFKSYVVGLVLIKFAFCEGDDPLVYVLEINK